MDHISRAWLTGFGKNFAVSYNVRKLIEEHGYKRIAFVAPTTRDTNKTMVLGDSGLLNAYPRHAIPEYIPSNTRVKYPEGATVDLYESFSPDRIRGGNFDLAVLDEWCAHKDPQYVLDMVSMALRYGQQPRMIITTTPRPIKPLKDLLEAAKDPANKIVVTRGSTYDNAANLPPAFLQQVKRTYEGTRLGRQELYGEVLDDLEGALFSSTDIEAGRIINKKWTDLQLTRIVVAIDPATTNNDSSNQTGIIVAGCDANGEGYILADYTMKGSPQDWGTKAVQAFYEFQADRIIAEVNQGGDMVEHVIKTIDRRVPYGKVRASRGKVTRAEPVGALYEQHKVHHVGGFSQLEDQMTSWLPGDVSPDRVDAMVWAITELLLTRRGASVQTVNYDL